MAIIDFNPIVKRVVGKFGELVFRRSHNGQTSVYTTPDMSEVTWSQAQKDHRQHFKEGVAYARAAIADPELRAWYVQVAIAKNKNPQRPFDMAQSDYMHGIDLLWKKYMGDQPKPENWDMERYSWYR